MRVLITGGSGYISDVLISELLIRGYKVTVIDNLMYKQDNLLRYFLDKNFKFIFGDVRDKDKLKSLCADADIILPLAAIVGFPACEINPELAKEVNTNHVRTICEVLKSNQKIIISNTNSGYGASSGDVYCDENTPLSPISVYGRTKCEAETTVLDAKGISLRLATVMGVSSRLRLDLLVNDFVFKAHTQGYIVLFEKDFKRNYIHIKDVASAFIHMIENYDKYQGEAFNVGLSSANLSKWELAHKIKEHYPKFSIQVDDIATDPDKRNYIVSNKKLEKTGWSPEYSLDDTIRELKHVYQIIQHTSQKYTNL